MTTALMYNGATPEAVDEMDLLRGQGRAAVSYNDGGLRPNCYRLVFARAISLYTDTMAIEMEVVFHRDGSPLGSDERPDWQMTYNATAVTEELLRALSRATGS